MTEPAPTPQDDFRRDALAVFDDVYRFARALARNEPDADDLVQETYLRAFKSWHTFQPGTDVRRWLFTICRNVFLRTQERAARLVSLDDHEDDEPSLLDRAAKLGADEAALLSRLDLQPALQQALAELQEPFRSAVVLVDLEEQPYEAAAEILGVPIGTVRSRLFRGRRILQDRLMTYARDAGFTSARSTPP